MCLAVPMRIIELEQNDERITGKVDLEGSSYAVDLSLVDDPVVGDFVIVHAGIAIEKLDREDADERLKLFAELALIYRQELGEDVTLVAPVSAHSDSSSTGGTDA